MAMTIEHLSGLGDMLFTTVQKPATISNTMFRASEPLPAGAFNPTAPVSTATRTVSSLFTLAPKPTSVPVAPVPVAATVDARMLMPTPVQTPAVIRPAIPLPAVRPVVAAARPMPMPMPTPIDPQIPWAPQIMPMQNMQAVDPSEPVEINSSSSSLVSATGKSAVVPASQQGGSKVKWIIGAVLVGGFFYWRSRQH